MPQTRTLLHQSPHLRVEQVRSHAREQAWSPCYQAPSARLVLAQCDGVVDFKLPQRTTLLDGMTAVFLPAGQSYQMRPGDGQEKTSVVVSWQGDAGLPSDFVDLDQGQIEASFLLSPQALWALQLHWSRLRQGCATGPSPRRVLARALLMARQPVALGASANAAVDRAQRFMAMRLAQDAAAPFSQQDVARAASCSLFHLARLFRQRLGVGMHGYRQRLRLALALQALAAGEANLAALADRLGYSQQSQMGAQFRAALGVTPGQARDALSGSTKRSESARI